MRLDLRTIVVVTLVTALIWLFAEGQSLRRASVTGEVRVMGPPGSSHVVRVVEPAGWQGAVRMTLQGAASRVGAMDSALRRAIELTPGAEGFPLQAGEQVVDLRAALRGHADLRSRGITLVDAEPATIRVLIEEVRTIDAPVRVDAPAGEVEGAAEASVSAVSVRVPASFPQDAEAYVTARIRPEDLRAFEPGRRATVRGVRLELSPALAGLSSVEITPTTVDVSLTVRFATDSIVLASVPVDLRLPAEELRRWEVEIAPGTRFIQNVKVTGPAEIIEQIRGGQLAVGAFVRLSYEELERGIGAKQAEFASMPTPLTFEAEDREVRLIIRAREAEGDPSGGPNGAVGGGEG